MTGRVTRTGTYLTETGVESGTVSFAPADVREQDARYYPHDEDCPRCGRRQWGLGPGTADPRNPSDAEQETCGACGYRWEDTAPMPEFERAGPGHWVAISNAYVILKADGGFVLRDGHGTFLGRFGSKPKAEAGAREDAIVKGGRHS